MQKQNWISTLAILMIFTFVVMLVISFLSQSQQHTNSKDLIEDSTYQEDKCLYGKLPPEIYLNIYIVKKGDTLLSIAKKELGSTSRIDEIKNLNRRRIGYESLYTSEVIEEGWQLYLPKNNMPPNSGDLVPRYGKVNVNKSGFMGGRMLVISNPQAFPKGGPTTFTSNTRFYGTREFNTGDCVIIIRDEETDTDIILATPKNIDEFPEQEIFTLADVTFPKHEAKCEYNFIGEEEVMNVYKVKPGDSINRIAKEQLGNTDRADEIIEANKGRYASLKNSNFIEQDWELLIPPSWTHKTLGTVTAFAGTVVSEDESKFIISKDIDYPGHLHYKKNPEVKYFSQENYKPGDCIVILSSRGNTLGIAPQSIDYIKAFKTGEY